MLWIQKGEAIKLTKPIFKSLYQTQAAVWVKFRQSSVEYMHKERKSPVKDSHGHNVNKAYRNKYYSGNRKYNKTHEKKIVTTSSKTTTHFLSWTKITGWEHDLRNDLTMLSYYQSFLGYFKLSLSTGHINTEESYSICRSDSSDAPNITNFLYLLVSSQERV